MFGTDDNDARALLTVTATMYRHLQRWADGSFTSRWTEPPAPPLFERLTADEQVAHLQRCGLAECLGGPFHPGIELTWTLRWPAMWQLAHQPRFEERQLYRLHLLPEGTRTPQDFGPVLTRAACLAPGGPLDAVGPGALTRWLGLPWQTDEASCNSSADYTPSTFLSMPTYWGARVPDQVLSSESWQRASDDVGGAAARRQRLKQLAHRSDWLRDVRGPTYFSRIDTMVREWWMLGIVEPKVTPAHLQSEGLPAIAFVESGRHPENAGSDPKTILVAAIEQLASPVLVSGRAIAEGVAAGATASAAPIVPPRRSFRQGEI